MDIVFPRCERKQSRYHFNNVFLEEALLCDRFYIYQIGELFCNDMEEIKPHKQFCAEVTYVISGKGVVSTNGEETHVAKNDCYLSFCDDVHAVRSDGEMALRYFFCGFNPADEKSAALIEDIRSLMEREGTRQVNLPELTSLFHTQMTELRGTHPYGTDLIGISLYRILTLVYRALSHKGTKNPEYHADEKSILTYQIMSYIDENVYAIKHLTELEAIFFFKYRYLEKCFLGVTGCTLSEYFRTVRMQTAAKDLERKRSITEISDKLNFSSIYAFSRAFSNHFGCSPSEYRRRFLANEAPKKQ